jgi:hypothetical protein
VAVRVEEPTCVDVACHAVTPEPFISVRIHAEVVSPDGVRVLPVPDKAVVGKTICSSPREPVGETMVTLVQLPVTVFNIVLSPEMKASAASPNTELNVPVLPLDRGLATPAA